MPDSANYKKYIAMASLYTRGKTIWMRWYQGGRQQYVSTKLPDSREGWKLARKLKLEKEFELSRKEYVIRHNKITLSEAYQKFDRDGNYRIAFNKLIQFSGDIVIDKVNPDLLKFFECEFDTLSINTKANYFNHLKTFFQFLVDNKYLKENPVYKIKSEERPVKVIPYQDVHKLLWYLRVHNTQQYLLIKLLIYTGIRISTALSLTWEDIDFNNKIIIFRNYKLKRDFHFPLYSSLYNFLYKYRSAGKLFNYTRRTSVHKFWRRAQKKLGLNKYSLHSIRKTFLTTLADSGISLYDLSVLADHRDTRTTKKYYLHANLQRIGREIQSRIEDNYNTAS